MGETSAMVSELERGRDAYSHDGWRAAYEALSEADRDCALEPDDLERGSRHALANDFRAIDPESVPCSSATA